MSRIDYGSVPGEFYITDRAAGNENSGRITESGVNADQADDACLAQYSVYGFAV